MSGNMFLSDKVGPVNRDQLKSIVKILDDALSRYQMFSSPPLAERTLGSSARCIDGTLGKKDLMGDIDIAVSKESDDELADLNHIESILKLHFPTMEVRTRSSLKIVSLLYVINDKHEVQIDFIRGDYEVLKFMFSSPDPSHKTEYEKGFYRNFYISALTQSMRKKIVENGESIAYAGPKLDRHKGITFEYRHHPVRKDNRGRVKQIKKISKEEFDDIYGVDIDLPQITLSSDREIVSYFFPKSSIPIEQYDTVETFRKAVSENYSDIDQKNIEERFKEILETSK